MNGQGQGRRNEEQRKGGGAKWHNRVKEKGREENGEQKRQKGV